MQPFWGILHFMAGWVMKRQKMGNYAASSFS